MVFFVPFLFCSEKLGKCLGYSQCNNKYLLNKLTSQRCKALPQVIYLFIYFVFLAFLGPLPWHMEVPRLGV